MPCIKLEEYRDKIILSFINVKVIVKGNIGLCIEAVDVTKYVARSSGVATRKDRSRVLVVYLGRIR
jgi:hypothetical protein